MWICGRFLLLYPPRFVATKTRAFFLCCPSLAILIFSKSIQVKDVGLRNQRMCKLTTPVGQKGAWGIRRNNATHSPISDLWAVVLKKKRALCLCSHTQNRAIKSVSMGGVNGGRSDNSISMDKDTNRKISRFHTHTHTHSMRARGRDRNVCNKGAFFCPCEVFSSFPFLQHSNHLHSAFHLLLRRLFHSTLPTPFPFDQQSTSLLHLTSHSTTLFPAVS